MPAEIHTLLSNCKGFLTPLVTVAIHTRMRKGELLSLKWDQVNFEQELITLSVTKNDERRDIPMDENAKAMLKETDRTGDLVFMNKRKRISPANLQQVFTDAVKASKLTDFRFHDLRHTFASNLVMAGVKIEKVQKLMGHKLLTMTQRYSHLAPGYLLESVRVLDEVMSQNSPQGKKVVQLTV